MGGNSENISHIVLGTVRYLIHMNDRSKRSVDVITTNLQQYDHVEKLLMCNILYVAKKRTLSP